MMQEVKRRDNYCFRPVIRMDFSVILITCIEVLKVLCQIWDASHKSRSSSSIDALLFPTIYTACSLSVFLLLISLCSAWCIYKRHAKTLYIFWWLFYMLTVFSFFNGCTNLTILSLGKDQFKLDCLKQSDRFNCIRLWQDSIISAALFTVLDVVINIAFCYAVYRCRVKVKRTSRVIIKPDYNSDPDEDGFQVVELK